MTLTELKYVVALAQERHFGRAAQKCFVTQPTLSLALAKLEDELGVRLFERNKNEVLVTSRGQAIVEQARRVLDEVNKIPHLARGGQDQLSGALRRPIVMRIAGADIGRRGGRIKRMRASSGVRPPLRRLQETQQVTMFSQSLRPPCDTGTT